MRRRSDSRAPHSTMCSSLQLLAARLLSIAQLVRLGKDADEPNLYSFVCLRLGVLVGNVNSNLSTEE